MIRKGSCNHISVRWGTMKLPIFHSKLAVAAPLLAVFTLPGVLSATGDSGKFPKFELKSEPPIREGALGGYASVIEGVSPSVVSVISTRTVEVASGPSYFQWDPNTGRLMQRAPAQRRAIPQPQGLGSGVIVTGSELDIRFRVVRINHSRPALDEVEHLVTVRVNLAAVR